MNPHLEIKNMTKTEYTEYEARVSRFTERSGVHVFSSPDNSEPSFSSRECECCKREKMAGDRYEVTGLTYDLLVVDTYSICSDCLNYNEYGQLDDQTMMEVEK